MKAVFSVLTLIVAIASLTIALIEEAPAQAVFDHRLITLNQSSENLSSNVIDLQTEVIKLRNQLEPRNISEAFPLNPLSSVDTPNNTYSEMKEGTIAGFGGKNSSPSVVK